MASVRYCLDNSIYVAAICAAPSHPGAYRRAERLYRDVFPGGLKKNWRGRAFPPSRSASADASSPARAQGVAVDFALRIVAELCGSQKSAAIKKSIQCQN